MIYTANITESRFNTSQTYFGSGGCQNTYGSSHIMILLRTTVLGLIADERVHRGQWPLGHILKVYQEGMDLISEFNLVQGQVM